MHTRTLSQPLRLDWFVWSRLWSFPFWTWSQVTRQCKCIKLLRNGFRLSACNTLWLQLLTLIRSFLLVGLGTFIVYRHCSINLDLRRSQIAYGVWDRSSPSMSGVQSLSKRPLGRMPVAAETSVRKRSRAHSQLKCLEGGYLLLENKLLMKNWIAFVWQVTSL